MGKYYFANVWRSSSNVSTHSIPNLGLSDHEIANVGSLYLPSCFLDCFKQAHFTTCQLRVNRTKRNVRKALNELTTKTWITNWINRGKLLFGNCLRAVVFAGLFRLQKARQTRSNNEHWNHVHVLGHKVSCFRIWSFSYRSTHACNSPSLLLPLRFPEFIVKVRSYVGFVAPCFLKVVEALRLLPERCYCYSLYWKHLYTSGRVDNIIIVRIVVGLQLIKISSYYNQRVVR